MRRPTTPKTSIIDGNVVTSDSGTQMKNGAATRTPSQPSARRAESALMPRYCSDRHELSAGRSVPKPVFTTLTGFPDSAY